MSDKDDIREIIERLARIEAKQEATTQSIEDFKANCRSCETKAAAVETSVTELKMTLYGRGNGDGLVKRFGKIEERVENIYLKMAAIGGAATLILVGGWNFIAGMFSGGPSP